jgi:anaerobic magnesium-protoporphyrin IX monomethyl ester cyclase
MSHLTTKKVVLFLPPYQGKPLGPSLSLLSLASPLRQEGFQISIIDGAIEPNFLDRLRSEIPNACCFGLSLLTGPMIRPAIEASRLVRRLHPNLPIVYGGWHPTLLPEQTLQADYVDVVVRGQGEATFTELSDCLYSRKSLVGVAGISYKVGSRMIHNPARPIIPLNALPMPAYDLVNTNAYQIACGVRKTVYASSVGCPYSCNYCTDTVFYQRRFNALSPERVVREVTDLVSRYALEEVSFLDSNFPVDVRRAIVIARGFIESGVKFRWTFQASTDLLCRRSDEEVRLLSSSGATHIGFGTESGSEEVLRLMNKPHQHIRDMHETARKCHQANIRVTFNLILGYPGESEGHRLETLRIMEEISRLYPNVSFSPNVFTAYPGIPIWNQMKELGLKEPQSLEEWAEVSLGRNRLPWFQGREFQRAKRMMSYFIVNHQLRKDTQKFASQTGKQLASAFIAPLAWRLRHKFYRFPLDLWLMQARNQMVMRRSLLTGSSLGKDLEKIG